MKEENKKAVVILTDFRSYQYYQIAEEIRRVLVQQSVQNSVLHWWDVKTNIKNVVFVGSVLKQCCDYFWRFDDSTNIIFYGVCEGTPILSNVEKLVFKRKNIKVIVPSEFVKERLEELDINVEEVIPHAINMNDSSINQEFENKLKHYFLNDKPFRLLLNVSDNNARKGLSNLLVAYKVLEKIFPDLFLILHAQAGIGFGGINIQKYMQILQIKRIWWTQMAGTLSLQKMNTLYKNAYLYPCSSFSEGFCLPLIEAYRFNVPIVAVDAKPFNEIVKNKETGLLIPFDHIEKFEIKHLMNAFMHVYDVDDFIDACTVLLFDNKLHEKMKNNIEKIKWNYHSDFVYQKFIKYLED